MSAWIPLLQTLSWVILVLVAVLIFRGWLAKFAEALLTRVNSGASLEVSGGPVKFRIEQQYQDLPNAEDVAATKPVAPSILAGSEELARSEELAGWVKAKDEYGRSHRGLHLVHVVAPSVRGTDWQEIFVFLKGHKRPKLGLPEDLSDVTKAEFFLGRSWGNRIFEVENRGGGLRIGLTAEAYGPVLCVCRVHFTTGEPIVLYRYLDFEMANILADRPEVEAAGRRA